MLSISSTKPSEQRHTNCYAAVLDEEVDGLGPFEAYPRRVKGCTLDA
jgi:hypothetical protein